MPRSSRALLAALGTASLFGAFATTATSQQTWTVAASGGAQFTQISAAVAAAADGDVILVGSGNYPRFTVSGKGLTIVGNGVNIFPGGVGPVATAPMIVVENLAAHQRTTIVGFGVLNMMTPPACVMLRNCSGTVWLQEIFSDSYGAPALRVENCADVALVDVYCQTNAGFTQQNGVGLPAEGAGFLNSRVRAYDCVFIGSRFTMQNNPFPALAAPTAGGSGVEVTDSHVVLQGCEAIGGTGSGLWTGTCTIGADGGDGALLRSRGGTPPKLRLLDSQLSAGSASSQTCGTTAVAGLPSRVLAGQLVLLAGDARLLRGPRSVTTPTTVSLDLLGQPGDTAFVFAAFPSPTTIVLGLPLHVTTPAIGLGFASIGSSHGATLAVAIPQLGAGTPTIHLALQSLVLDASANAFATNPAALIVR